MLVFFLALVACKPTRTEADTALQWLGQNTDDTWDFDTDDDDGTTIDRPRETEEEEPREDQGTDAPDTRPDEEDVTDPGDPTGTEPDPDPVPEEEEATGSCAPDWYEEDDAKGSVYLGDLSDYADTKHWAYADTYLTFTGDDDFFYFYVEDAYDDWFNVDVLVVPPASLDLILDIFYWEEDTGTWDWVAQADAGWAGDPEYYRYEGDIQDNTGYYGALVTEYENLFDCNNTYSIDMVNDYWDDQLADVYSKHK